MKKKLFFILLASMLLNVFAGTAQILDPVSWKYSVKKVSNTEFDLIFEATIEPKWHMYSQFFDTGGPVKMTFEFDKTANYEAVGGVQEVSKPHTEHDDIFDIDVQYFATTARLVQRIKAKSDKPFTITGAFEYQVCYDDKCVLFNPDFEFRIEGAKVAANTTENQTETEVVVEETTETEQVQEETVDSLPLKETVIEEKTEVERSKNTPVIAKDNAWAGSATSDSSSVWWFFFVAMGFGFTALITPCVFPMIPMTVSFFMHGADKAKNKMNAMIYGASIVLIYTVPIALIIAIANVFGNDSVSGDFANFLSTHWAPNVFFFLIFLIFAASFFGMFEITMPSWLLNKTDKQADRGGLIGIFFMAFTLVLVSFSCTGPIVGGILVESTQGGNILKPIVGMLGFSIGVAAPFTVFALFPQMLKKLPKSGGWLNSVKVVLGFIELALGLKFLSIADQTYHWGLLDREIYIAMWIIIFGLMGMYLLGKIKFAHDSDLPHVKVPRLMLAILTFSFVIYLIPGMVGAPLKALSGYLPPQSTHDFDLVSMLRGDDEASVCETPKYTDELHLPHGLHGYFDYYQAVKCSKEQNKPIFIDFTGHGCVNCREMEANVWADPRVLKLLREEYVILAMYVDDKKIELPESEWFTSSYDGKVKKNLGKQNADMQIVNFGVNSQPYYVLLDNENKVLVEPRAYDKSVEEFITFLKQSHYFT